MRTDFSFDEMAACAKRELTYRRRVYLRLVDEGKMKPEKAARENDLMKAIAEYFERKSQRELL